MFWSVAFAQGAAGGVAPAKPSILEFLFPIMAMMFVFYFLQSRPQQKRMREHQGFLSSLKRGDQVVTSGGIHGEITGLNEKVVTLEISDNVRIKVLRSQILAPTKDLHKE